MSSELIQKIFLKNNELFLSILSKHSNLDLETLKTKYLNFNSNKELDLKFEKKNVEKLVNKNGDFFFIINNNYSFFIKNLI